MDILAIALVTILIVIFGMFGSAVIGYLASSSWRTKVDRLADSR